MGTMTATCTGTAAVKVDHTVDSIRFDHPSIGEVTVRQDLGLAGEDRDATARLCWDAAFPMAQFLCENPTLVTGRDVVELGAGPGLPGVVAAKLAVLIFLAKFKFQNWPQAVAKF